MIGIICTGAAALLIGYLLGKLHTSIKYGKALCGATDEIKAIAESTASYTYRKGLIEAATILLSHVNKEVK